MGAVISRDDLTEDQERVLYTLLTLRGESTPRTLAALVGMERDAILELLKRLPEGWIRMGRVGRPNERFDAHVSLTFAGRLALQDPDPM